MSCLLCSRKVFARGWCGPHYKRWYRYGKPTAGGAFRRFTELRGLSPYERFVRQIEKTPTCWNYRIDVNSNGYGRIKVHGKRRLAHRYAYELAHGYVTTGKQVHHSCDNRLCVRATHLWEGTQSENIKDMYAKGRGRH